MQISNIEDLATTLFERVATARGAVLSSRGALLDLSHRDVGDAGHWLYALVFGLSMGSPDRYTVFVVSSAAQCCDALNERYRLRYGGG
ncbi:hypothetical protein [Mycobacterium uberis]|uniref:hypothetical protein n=1 Tax=Mycobacterium uberis TaxID=2162698 RepID=UPI0026D1A7BF